MTKEVIVALSKLNKHHLLYLNARKISYASATTSEEKQRIIYTVDAYLDALEDSNIITLDDRLVLFGYFTTEKEN